jgi:hypothetical protein
MRAERQVEGWAGAAKLVAPTNEVSYAPENKLNNNHVTISTAQERGKIISAVQSLSGNWCDRDGATSAYISTGIRNLSLKNQHLNATASHVRVTYLLK